LQKVLKGFAPNNANYTNFNNLFNIILCIEKCWKSGWIL